MQEEVNEKTISLCIKGGKITAQILKVALIKLLAEMDKKKQQAKGEKSQCKKTGRQSIKSLQKSGAQITNIVVTDNNIKSFDRVARKYGIQGEKRSMNTPNIFDRLSRKIHHHSDMEPHESDSGPPFDEVEPLNFQDEESVVHTVLEDFYAVGTLADELTDGFHMEAHGYLDREEVNARLIAFARKLEQVLDKWETHAALLA